MSFVAGNRFLTREEMTVNARYIASYLIGRGWTRNAVAGMLGNMESESTINPAIWENLDEWNTDGGFGLVQWTPATKYLTWCAENILDPMSMDSALMRIEYELAEGLQWISTEAYPLTFAEFKISTLPASYLGMAFLYNYERPASLEQANRGSQAAAWYEVISGVEGGDTPSPTPTKKKSMPLWLLLAATRRRIH